jgi:glucose/arabinose dehydrogenase
MLRLHTVISGIDSLIALDADKEGSLYLAQQTGTVLRLSPQGDISTVVDLASKVVPLNRPYDERGLLGLALSPNFERNQTLYLYYSTPASRFQEEEGYYNCIAAYLLMEEREVLLLKIPYREGVHNGGCLAFGPDGYLYVSTGDGGPQEDPEGHAQNTESLRGKILRLSVEKLWSGDVDLTDPYVLIPPDNPFVDVRCLCNREIYAYGFRNPWRFSFDREGVLYVADVGYQHMEEVSIVEKGDNAGWNYYEGTERTYFDITDRSDPDAMEKSQRRARSKKFLYPIFQYQHRPGRPQAIIGGYVTALGYLCADVSGTLMLWKPDRRGVWHLMHQQELGLYVRSFGTDGSDVYLISAQSMELGSTTLHRVIMPPARR